MAIDDRHTGISNRESAEQEAQERERLPPHDRPEPGDERQRDPTGASAGDSQTRQRRDSDE